MINNFEIIIFLTFEFIGTISSLQGLFLLRCCSELMSDKSPILRKELGDEIWKTLTEIGK